MMRLFFAHLTRPLRWRNPRATARLLSAFARAERSSYFDMMAAANATTSGSRCAQYLAHALDENRHAVMFRRRALELDPSLAHEPLRFHADFEHLFERLGEAQLMAFVHLGEKRGCAQMRLYRDELRARSGSRREDEKTMAIFDAVIADETRHVSYSLALASELGASFERARAWEAWRGWMRTGSRLSSAIFVLSMSVLYLALFPLALLERARRS